MVEMKWKDLRGKGGRETHNKHVVHNLLKLVTAGENERWPFAVY